MFNFNVTIIQGVSNFETVFCQNTLAMMTNPLSSLHNKPVVVYQTKPLFLRPRCIVPLRGGGEIEKYGKIHLDSTTMPEMAENSPMAKTGILDLQQAHVSVSHGQSQIS